MDFFPGAGQFLPFKVRHLFTRELYARLRAEINGRVAWPVKGIKVHGAIMGLERKTLKYIWPGNLVYETSASDEVYRKKT